MSALLVHKATGLRLHSGTEQVRVDVPPTSHRRLHGGSRGEKSAVQVAREAVEETPRTKHSRPLTRYAFKAEIREVCDKRRIITHTE